jgi:DMSO/TMAO reductase YedYZ heme-binding membrane subunit
MGLLYAILAGGIVLFLCLVFQALLGLRIVKIKGPNHWKVHRYLAFTIIGLAAIHGFIAAGHIVFAWF